MYVEQSAHQLPAPVCADVLTAVLRLNIAPGPGGSRILSVTADEIENLRQLGAAQLAIAALWPSSQIVAHRDAPIVGRRHHIPLQTNEGCWVFHDGVWQHLAVGHCYQMDPTGWHGAVNWGHEIRYHLIVDVG